MRRRPIVPIALAVALAATFTSSASADESLRVQPTEPTPWQLGDGPSADEIVQDLWFVEFEAAPSARGGDAGARGQERSRFRAQAQDEGVEVEEREDYGTLFNGITVEAGLAEIATIRDLADVRAVYPVAEVAAPQPEEITPDLQAALAMTGANVAGSELGLDGEGLSVAVIDTGIDYNHPDLGGTGDDGARLTAGADRTLEHPRISHGWDYVGDDFNPADPDAPQEPSPGPDPRDVQGHGSHVAGIVGADAADEDGVSGVAPGVTLGAYKVFGPGSTTSEVIVSALEDAFEDGMDIVNMSLGATLAWGQDYPTTQASNQLVAEGVTVVNSAGNDGDLGAYSLSAPANAHDAISVASADNTEQMTAVFEVDEVGQVPYLPMAEAPAPPTEGESEPLVDIGRACVEEFGDELTGDPAGAVALSVRGDCTFAEKYEAAVAAGAVGVVMYNNAPGLFAGGGIEPTDDVWAAGISQADGQAILALLDAGDEVTLTFTDEVVSTPNPTGGLASAFTSYGHDVELELAPSVMAPGGLITSTYPLARGGYAMLSGTSMSAPHVAGAVALLLQARPDLDPARVRDRLQNTATPADWSLSPGQDLLDHTHRQGAGMLGIDRAITSDQTVRPGQVSVADADTVTETLTVTNDGDTDVTYTVTHEPTVATAGSTFTPGFFLAPADVTVDETVVVPAGGSIDVPVTITAPDAGLANHQYGGYVTMTPTDGDATALSVPYGGFDGDYVADMGLLGYWEDEATYVDVDPVLARVDGDGALQPVSPNHTFHLGSGEVPVIAPFYGHFPEELEVHAIGPTGRRFLVAQDSYLPRSPQPGVVQPIAWDGMVAAGGGDQVRPAPPGPYRLELRVLRATGDAANPDHWDVWESPTFQLSPWQGRPTRPGPGASSGLATIGQR